MSKASLRQVGDDILYSGSSFSAAIVIALQSTFSSCASCTLCSTLHIVIAPSPLLVYVALCATRAPNMMINLMSVAYCWHAWQVHSTLLLLLPPHVQVFHPPLLTCKCELQVLKEEP